MQMRGREGERSFPFPFLSILASEKPRKDIVLYHKKLEGEEKPFKIELAKLYFLCCIASSFLRKDLNVWLVSLKHVGSG